MTLKNYWDKPENRARASERMKAYWARVSISAVLRYSIRRISDAG
jgi:hypothetical protein